MDADIPPAWEWSAAEIVRQHWRKVLVLGDVDRGKSTYCRFLSHWLRTAGFRVALVDADVGQKDIGPPAAITLGYPGDATAFATVPPAAWYFVGAVTPVGHLLPMVIGTRQLVDAAQAAFVIINTTGFVHGVGRVLKGYKIEALRPDAIVALEQDTELQPLLKAYRNYRTLRLRSSVHVQLKTPEQRRQAREQAFGRYFAPAPEVLLPCRRLIFQRAAGPASFGRDLLCGVADRRNNGRGLALITGIDWRQDTIVLRTPVPAGDIRILQAGDLYLTPEGCELGRK